MDDAKKFQIEIQTAFLVEASDLLKEVESTFLDLEKNPEDLGLLDKLLRMAHNFKGAGKTVGFDELSLFSHQMENLLVAIKSREILISSSIIELLLFCCDKLKNDVAILQANPESTLDHKVISNLILCVLEKKQMANSIMDTEKKSVIQEVPVVEKVNRPEMTRADVSDGFLRISVKKIDELLNNFGEQVILQSVLDHSKFNLAGNIDLVTKTITQLSKLTYDLQHTAISLRMVSLRHLFSRLERTLRDTSAILGKKINFEVAGNENELDKTISDALLDPLTHMIRNAVDHGIETAEERRQCGKPEEGHIALRGARRGGSFYITIEDDGKGLDPEKILSKAQKLGLVRPDQNLSKEQICNLIFENGLSTRDVATDISGRGVGMNVVKETIEAVKGQCIIESNLGKGTKFTIKLPLTLAIFNGMIFKLNGIQYVVPSSDVHEIVSVSKAEYRMINEQERCIQIREMVLPILDLRQIAKIPGVVDLEKKNQKQDTLLIIKSSSERYAIIVDELVSQQKIVHKNLGPEMSQIPCVTGGTILGDGTVALILDLSSLAVINKRRGTS